MVHLRAGIPPPRPVLLQLGLALLLAGLGLPAARSHPQAGWPGGSTSVALECRLGQRPWQPCRMEVEEVGVHWTLVIGSQRLAFRHDGRGGVSMQAGRGPWRTVASRWEPLGQLCWDGVCARGDLPLD